ncbi:hypothetical protein G7046_g6336 [Stylonectria norvegica]|nr:hypothetical protein G7046_g6336 [Stylonectria norvegica]
MPPNCPSTPIPSSYPSPISSTALLSLVPRLNIPYAVPSSPGLRHTADGTATIRHRHRSPSLRSFLFAIAAGVCFQKVVTHQGMAQWPRCGARGTRPPSSQVPAPRQTDGTSMDVITYFRLGRCKRSLIMNKSLSTLSPRTNRLASRAGNGLIAIKNSEAANGHCWTLELKLDWLSDRIVFTPFGITLAPFSAISITLAFSKPEIPPPLPYYYYYYYYCTLPGYLVHNSLLELSRFVSVHIVDAALLHLALSPSALLHHQTPSPEPPQPPVAG